MNYIFMFVGLVAHIILKYRDAYTTKELFDWRRHLVITFCNLPVGILIIHFNYHNLDEMTACFIGYALDSVIKNLESFKWKKIGDG